MKSQPKESMEIISTVWGVEIDKCYPHDDPFSYPMRITWEGPDAYSRATTSLAEWVSRTGSENCRMFYRTTIVRTGYDFPI
jgi:hypothetical protein